MYQPIIREISSSQLAAPAQFYDHVEAAIAAIVDQWLASDSLELCVGADDHSEPQQHQLRLTLAAWDPAAQLVPTEIWQGGHAASIRKLRLLVLRRKTADLPAQAEDFLCIGINPNLAQRIDRQVCNGDRAAEKIKNWAFAAEGIAVTGQPNLEAGVVGIVNLLTSAGIGDGRTIARLMKSWSPEQRHFHFQLALAVLRGTQQALTKHAPLNYVCFWGRYAGNNWKQEITPLFASQLDVNRTYAWEIQPDEYYPKHIIARGNAVITDMTLKPFDPRPQL